MPLLGLFGISNDGLNLAVNLLVVFLVIVYLALIVWTFLDARRRIEDSWLVACATAAAFFPFVGAMVYAILRPPEFIEDRKERELEIRAAELRVKQLGEQTCPNCEFPVERSYLRCPSCEARLKDPCPSCSKPIDPRWAMCPYCETPIRRRAPERRPRGRRARADRQPPSRAAREAAREQARSGREARQPKQPAQRPARSKARSAAASRSAGSRPAPSAPRASSSDSGAAGSDSQGTAERRPVRSSSRASDKRS